MDELRGKRVLVTGAASGIGRGAALAFAKEGCKLVLVDIDRDGLGSVEGEIDSMGGDCVFYEADVSNREQVTRVAEAVDSSIGGVDILANVAGVAIVGDLVDMTMEDWDWIMGVNLWGPINTITAFLPGMIDRKSGHIVNVASLGGLISHAMLIAYCTTKFGLVGLSEALGQEVREHNVFVTAFCPGLTDTPIIDHMKMRGFSREKLRRSGESIMWLRPVIISAERTGELIIEAVKKKKPLMVTTLAAKIVYILSRLSPGLLRAFLVRVRKLDNRIYR